MLGSESVAGVDFKRFCTDTINREWIPQQIGIDANACVFLLVGRLAKDKGVFDLIQASRELATAAHNVALWVHGYVGDVANQYLRAASTTTLHSNARCLSWPRARGSNPIPGAS